MNGIPDEYFQRQDESSDSGFYQTPRLVAHIDADAIAALGDFLRPLIPDDADVLDLMTAYLSHLPPDVKARCRRVAGLGMNAAEMAANGQLTDHVVHDLNADPPLPYSDASFVAVLCTVSVQYLLRPVEVFSEVLRVLKPGGIFLVSFSNRCFPTKATRFWLSTDDFQHSAFIRLCLEQSGDWTEITAYTLSPNPPISDPLYAVTARKPGCFRV